MRLAPGLLLKRLAQRESYQVLYLHPHDFDLDLPPLPNGSALSNVRKRIRIGKLRDKVLMLFRECEVLSCGELLARTK